MHSDINDTIQNNKGLIFKQLRKLFLLNDPEALSIGYEALYRAILEYDEGKTTKFSTFASVCIYNALGTYLRHLNRVRQVSTVSYNALSSCNGEENGEYINILEGYPSAESVIIATELTEDIGQALITVRSRINKAQKGIMDCWVDGGFSITTVDIAKLSGLSQSYVSQALARIKYLLRKELEGSIYER